MYILKQIPEDFVVDEISEKEFSNEKGKYCVYLLKKRSYNTEDAVQKICRHLNIHRRNIGYAGAKDRNAVTSQFVSVLGKTKELQLKDISFKHIGFMDEPISLGSLKGNKFRITIRNIHDEKIKKLDYFINYFDSQRFSKNNAVIGKYIMKKRYKDACELLIEEDSKLSEPIKHFLEKNKNAYLNAMKLVQRKTLMIYLHAYQSLLWNRAVEESLKEKINIEKIPLLGFGTEFEGEIKEIYEKILFDENITLRDFILRDFPEISLEGDYRKVKMKIEDLEILKEEEDELNKGKKKVVVEFFLQKGAYATMAVRNMVEE